MKKVISLALAAALCCSVGFSGCKSANPGTTNGKQTLTVWDWSDVYKNEYSKAINPVLKKFKSDNPNVTLKTEPIANDDIRTKLLTAVSANNLPDVAYIDGQNLTEFQSTGILSPLDSYVSKWGQKSDYPDNVWKTVVFDGSVYGIPGDGDVRTLIYRTDLFKKAGIAKAPSNWSELEEDAKKLTANGVWGFALNAGDSEHTSMRSLPWIWDLGGNLADSKGNPTLNDPAVAKVVTFMNKLVNTDKVAPPDSYLNTKKQVANLLNGGRAAMGIVGSWEWNGDASFLKNAQYKDDFASAPIPVPDGSKVTNSYTAAGYGTWVIFKNCQAKDAAWDWIKLCTTTSHMVDIFKYGTGNLGLRKSVVKDPVFSQNSAFKSFVDVMPNAKARPNSKYYDLISQQYRGAIQKVLTGKSTVDAALKNAQNAAVSQSK